MSKDSHSNPYIFVKKKIFEIFKQKLDLLTSIKTSKGYPTLFSFISVLQVPFSDTTLKKVSISENQVFKK